MPDLSRFGAFAANAGCPPLLDAPQNSTPPQPLPAVANRTPAAIPQPLRRLELAASGEARFPDHEMAEELEKLVYSKSTWLARFGSGRTKRPDWEAQFAHESEQYSNRQQRTTAELPIARAPLRKPKFTFYRWSRWNRWNAVEYA